MLCKNDKGFSLFELIVVVFIFTIFMGVVHTMSSNVIIFIKEEKTQRKLIDLAEAFITYYDIYGNYSSSLSNLQDLFNGQNPEKDDWGNDITYLTNIMYEGKTYPAIFISKGKNGVLDSNINVNNVILNNKDIYAFVTNGMIAKTKRYKTQEKLYRINSALNAYRNSGGADSRCYSHGSSSCVLVLFSNDLIKGTDIYDEWGSNFILNSSASAFKSCGPDRICNTSDDESI